MQTTMLKEIQTKEEKKGIIILYTKGRKSTKFHPICYQTENFERNILRAKIWTSNYVPLTSSN